MGINEKKSAKIEITNDLLQRIIAIQITYCRKHSESRDIKRHT